MLCVLPVLLAAVVVVVGEKRTLTDGRRWRRWRRWTAAERNGRSTGDTGESRSPESDSLHVTLALSECSLQYRSKRVDNPWGIWGICSSDEGLLFRHAFLHDINVQTRRRNALLYAVGPSLYVIIQVAQSLPDSHETSLCALRPLAS